MRGQSIAVHNHGFFLQGGRSRACYPPHDLCVVKNESEVATSVELRAVRRFAGPTRAQRNDPGGVARDEYPFDVLAFDVVVLTCFSGGAAAAKAAKAAESGGGAASSAAGAAVVGNFVRSLHQSISYQATVYIPIMKKRAPNSPRGARTRVYVGRTDRCTTCNV